MGVQEFCSMAQRLMAGMGMTPARSGCWGQKGQWLTMGCLLETHPALGVSTGWAELCLDILEGAVVVSDNFVSACGEEKCSLIKAVAKMREIFSAAPKLGSMRRARVGWRLEEGSCGTSYASSVWHLPAGTLWGCHRTAKAKGWAPWEQTPSFKGLGTQFWPCSSSWRGCCLHQALESAAVCAVAVEMWVSVLLKAGSGSARLPALLQQAGPAGSSQLGQSIALSPCLSGVESKPLCSCWETFSKLPGCCWDPVTSHFLVIIHHSNGMLLSVWFLCC